MVWRERARRQSWVPDRRRARRGLSGNPRQTTGARHALPSPDRRGPPADAGRIGVSHIDELFADIPAGKLQKKLPRLPLGKTELEVERHLGRLAAMNVTASEVPFFVGAGAYKHHVPATVDHLIQRSSS